MRLTFLATVFTLATGYAVSRKQTPPTKLPVTPIEWLHIPKTGTSFGNTLLLWACPDLDRTTLWVNVSMVLDVPDKCKTKFYIHPAHREKWFIGDHASLQNRTDDQVKSIFTFVRSPKTKIASGYHYIKSLGDKKIIINPTVTELEICGDARNSTFSHMAFGAQVKIIAGEPMSLLFKFSSAEPPTALTIEHACARLYAFAFVGVTEFWEASICLFHEKFGGHSNAAELVNVRKGNYRSNGSVES